MKYLTLQENKPIIYGGVNTKLPFEKVLNFPQKKLARVSQAPKAQKNQQMIYLNNEGT